MLYPKSLSDLIDAFCILPSVGTKSAQRMVLYLLEFNRDGAKNLANKIQQVLENIKHCKICRNYCEDELCKICDNPSRDVDKLCVVETPADVMAIEECTQYKGKYFVLMGRLSPIDGIGPQQLGMDDLQKILNNNNDLSELIIATNATIEGEATSLYIQNMCHSNNNNKFKITQLAQGMPIGGELEYINANTINQAFVDRVVIDKE
ncbi:MAG: recombination protein RecR [Gammaproteobacteria bacterium]|nr:MAG: recombination protein RecR [Gammaproteobacteria bacterium]